MRVLPVVRRSGTAVFALSPESRESRESRESAAPAYALLCEKSFSTGTPTLWRAREAQSRWKNSST
ncbi:hypothetical protein GCM10010415_09630 [Streptomyces atrovirens]